MVMYVRGQSSNDGIESTKELDIESVTLRLRYGIPEFSPFSVIWNTTVGQLDVGNRSTNGI